MRAWLAAGLAVFGDLDGDLVADAAVVVKIDLGGSGTFVHLVAMLDREGRPVQAGREYLGDRVRVQSIAISGGRIEVTMFGHGPDDGMCCPTVEMGRAFTYRSTEGRPGRRLRRVSYWLFESSPWGGRARPRPEMGWGSPRRKMITIEASSTSKSSSHTDLPRAWRVASARERLAP